MAQLYGRNGKTNDWKPLNCKQDADGNWQLCVDTELSVDSLTLEINNIKIGSTDQSAANAVYLKTKADGTVYIEGAVTIISSGIPLHYNGNAMLVKATVSFAGTTKHVQIENMDGVKDLLVSFDSELNWKTIQPGYILDIDCAITSLDIKASADNCLYEILSVE